MVNACDKANVKLFWSSKIVITRSTTFERCDSKTTFRRIYLVNMNVFWTRRKLIIIKQMARTGNLMAARS